MVIPCYILYHTGLYFNLLWSNTEERTSKLKAKTNTERNLKFHYRSHYCCTCILARSVCLCMCGCVCVCVSVSMHMINDLPVESWSSCILLFTVFWMPSNQSLRDNWTSVFSLHNNNNNNIRQITLTTVTTRTTNTHIFFIITAIKSWIFKELVYTELMNWVRYN